MNLTQVAIEKNRVTIVALFAIVVAGSGTYLNMPRAEDPGFIIRTALVITHFPGASPERVEQLVTDKLEKAIQEMPEIDYLTSQSKTGTSIIYVNIQESYKEMRPLWDDLRRKVEDAESELPDGIRGPFVNDEFGDVFGVIITIIGDGFTYAELKDVADDVRDELLLIDDVAKVDIYGDQEERIFVEYSNARLAELGLSPGQLQAILESRNIINPGGDVRTEFEEIVLEPSGNFESLTDLQRTVITVPDGDLVFLQDVADVRRGYIDPPRTKMRASIANRDGALEGRPSLGLAVSMREGGNIITMGEDVRKTMARLQALYPHGLELDVIQFQPESVDKKVSAFVGNLLQAIALVAVSMLIALGLRTGLIVASLIPTAMLASFATMGFFGIGLDQMSLAALIIALGMLVDNAIVMSESIMVQMATGKAAVAAAIDSAKELTVPLLTSSLTTAAAFLPIYLAESGAGEYTAPIFQVVTITLLASWLVALTVIPLLCVTFLKVSVDPKGESFDSRFYVLYRSILLGILRHRGLFVGVVVGAFAASLWAFRFVPNIFFPPNDRPTFTVDIELPIGTPIARTEAVVTEVEDFIERELAVGPGREEGVVSWGVFIGEGAPRFILTYSPEQTAPDYAFFLINATSRPYVDELIPRLERMCAARFPDLKATVIPLQLGPPAWPPVEIRLSGRDTDVLFGIVDAVKQRLREIPGTKLIDDDWGARSKKLVVAVNQPRARRAGVTSQDVATSLQTFLSGFDTTEFREGDKLIPVTLRSAAAQREDIGGLDSINIFAQLTGQSVPLKQIADIKVEWQPAIVRRRDRLRTVTVEAGTQPGITAAAVTAELRPWLEEQAASWGPGYSWEFGGAVEKSSDSQESIAAKLPIAGLLILLLLVGQFNSIRRPLIILMTIPLSLIGVVIGLLVMNSYFGFMTLLGIVSLAGVVINNAIILIDRIKIEIEDNGRTPQAGVIEAAQRRLRPILLTTATTVFGLLPLYFGGGPMYEPMAVALIFGLLFATLLTLGVVPVLYSLLFGVGFKDFGAEAGQRL